MAWLHDPRTPYFPMWAERPSEEDVMDNMPMVRPSVCRMCQSKDDRIADLQRQLTEAKERFYGSNRAIADLDRQLAEARKETLCYESEIAEVCPEDLTLKESIAAFKREARKQAFEEVYGGLMKIWTNQQMSTEMVANRMIKYAEALRLERDKPN